MDTRSPDEVHRPVMVGEVLEALSPARGEIFVDLTVGAGGHAFEIASRLGPEGLLIGMDLDEDVIEFARERLAEEGLARSVLFQGNYTGCREALGDAEVDQVDGILLDLGVSSLQLGDAERGFSFSRDGPLDMRMDRDGLVTAAAEIVNRAPERELSRIIWEYGQERFSLRIARAIVRERQKAPIETTTRLASIVARACPRRGRWRIHPATRTFQALRIEVNHELDNLKSIIGIAPGLLGAGGRIAVISFHSLEDRIVKEGFRNGAREGVYRLITKKPLRPSPEEVEVNPRARSARLRSAQRSVL
ncbi:MAG: 16S rRNA (cytosine(1402)-N(4))-methyltransferase RsmH [Planctomycetes bacterium]|nr:16S rRNA (cytosine(1402)-N(4))-methyltransferase RsmH [Planctomycetota bacterium]